MSHTGSRTTASARRAPIPKDFTSRRSFLSAQGPSLLSIPARVAFQLHLTPLNSTPTSQVEEELSALPSVVSDVWAANESIVAACRLMSEVRSIHWSPYDRVRVVNAVS